jgi:cholesterol transport system auxiliary component
VNSESSYLLTKTPDYFPKKHTRSATVLVLMPVASNIYNTDSMAYTRRAYEVGYFSQNRWAETPPQMLQPLIVQTLQNTHYFKAIASPPFLGRYDFVLDTQILTLQQDYTQVPAKLQFFVRVQITKVATNRVKATKEFKLEVPMQQYTPYGGVIAANHATKELLIQIAAFCYKECR